MATISDYDSQPVKGLEKPIPSSGCEDTKSVQPMLSPTEYHLYKFMEALFWNTFCPRPDGRFLKLRGFVYNATGRVAGYFHRKTCTICLRRGCRR